MEERRKDPSIPGLLDEGGRPLDARIERALRALVPRFRREYRMIADEVLVIEMLEEAGRKIAGHERRVGTIEHIHEFAWVTLRNLAIAHLRLASSKMTRTALMSSEGQAALARAVSHEGSPEQIERRVLCHELLAQLTDEERQLCIWKAVGVPSREIARHVGLSVTAVNTAHHRAIKKLRLAVSTRS